MMSSSLTQRGSSGHPAFYETTDVFCRRLRGVITSCTRTRRRPPRSTALRFAEGRTPTTIAGSRIKRCPWSSRLCIQGKTVARCSEAGLGVTRKGRLTDAQAANYTRGLQSDRKNADYGFGADIEPLDVIAVDARMAQANQLIEDLKTLL